MKFEVIATIEAMAKIKEGLKSSDGRVLTPEIVFKDHFAELVKLIDGKGYAKVSNSKIHNSVKIAEDIYTSFVELRLSIEEIEGLIGFIVDSGPVSLEILKPDGEFGLNLDSGKLESVLNDLIAKIQEYDRNLKLVTSQLVKLNEERKGKQ